MFVCLLPGLSLLTLDKELALIVGRVLALCGRRIGQVLWFRKLATRCCSSLNSARSVLRYQSEDCRPVARSSLGARRCPPRYLAAGGVIGKRCGVLTRLASLAESGMSRAMASRVWQVAVGGVWVRAVAHHDSASRAFVLACSPRRVARGRDSHRVST